MTKIFLTLYACLALMWIAALPMISYGMGGGKPHHDWWKHFIDGWNAVVMTAFIITGFVHAMIAIWQ